MSADAALRCAGRGHQLGPRLRTPVSNAVKFDPPLVHVPEIEVSDRAWLIGGHGPGIRERLRVFIMRMEALGHPHHGKREIAGERSLVTIERGVTARSVKRLARERGDENGVAEASSAERDSQAERMERPTPRRAQSG